MNGALRLFLLLVATWLGLAPLAADAHIGSPDVIFEGMAGPYPLRVIVRPPPVVPGRAEIDVRYLGEGAGPAKVTVLPVNGRAGLNGAPTPDEATPVQGDLSLRHAELWLMTTGSYSVHVDVSGDQGSGKVVVPVVSIATRRLDLSPALGGMLLALGGLLFVGAISLVALGVRESVLPPGEAPKPFQIRRGRILAGAAAAVFMLALYGGKHWWDEVDQFYRSKQIYRPIPLQVTMKMENDVRLIHVQLDRKGSDRNRMENLGPLLPDHGKLMHVFLVREPAQDAFAHLHPVRAMIKAQGFEAAVPALPAGHYQVYADVTFEDGFAATLTAAIDLPPGSASGVKTDPDDSWVVSDATDTEFKIEAVKDGARPKTIRAGEPVDLSFVVKDSAGRSQTIEPYLGMLGHAAVQKTDGSVFVHLHPAGTASMASQHFFEQQAAAVCDPATLANFARSQNAPPGEQLTIPYAFPTPGRYRLWVQAKVSGRVITQPFDFDVQPGA